jgi:hypothetical protein
MLKRTKNRINNKWTNKNDSRHISGYKIILHVNNNKTMEYRIFEVKQINNQQQRL